MITVRNATALDIDAVVYLFDQYRTFYKQPSDIDAAKVFLLERLENRESQILIALKEGEVVGFTQLYPIFSSVSLGRAWLLNDLFVNPQQRKQGVAQALLEAAKTLGKNTDAKWLLLQTTIDNTAAQSVYEQNGWIKDETSFFYTFSL